LRVSSVDSSIAMKGSVANVDQILVRSMMGKVGKILGANVLLSRGESLVVGENTTIHLWSDEGKLPLVSFLQTLADLAQLSCARRDDLF